METTKTTVKDKLVYETESPLCSHVKRQIAGYECRQGFGTSNRCLPVLGASSCASIRCLMVCPWMERVAKTL